MMKVIISGTHAEVGGAARAAARLSKALANGGIDVTRLVQRADGVRDEVISVSRFDGQGYTRLRLALDQIPTLRYPKFLNRAMFSPGGALGHRNLLRIVSRADILNLQWVCKGFWPLSVLRDVTRPVVWTLHDMWPLTGGCHYDSGCRRFMDLCGRCPVLGSNREDDLSTRVFKKKQLSYSALDLSFIAPSRWLAELAAASPLGRGRLVRVIPNTLDRSIFAPTNARAYRARLGLPETGYVIAFAAMGGASEPRKGFDLLVGALPRVATLLAPKSIHVLVIGGSAAMVPPKNGITVRGTGHLDTDKAVAEVLNAVDVLVAPSRQDNLPNTVMEALSCGLPCVAFDVGGMPDLIDHKQNGYLAQPFDTSDLAHGIAWVIEDSERYDGLRHAARDSTRRFDPVSVATQHIALYREIVERHRGATSA